MVMPKQYEDTNDRQKAYEQRNKDAGNRKISFYLQAEGQVILDQFKNEFGVSNVTLINSLFSAAKEKPFLLKAVMGYDPDSISDAIKYLEVKLKLAKEMSALAGKSKSSEKEVETTHPEPSM